MQEHGDIFDLSLIENTDFFFFPPCVCVCVFLGRFCALVKRRAEGASPGSASMVPCRPDFAPPSHRCVPTDVDPELVYLCRHVYDFRYGRILKNLQ